MNLSFHLNRHSSNRCSSIDSLRLVETNVLINAGHQLQSKIDDIKRFFRTSRWHLGFPIRRPYPEPELISVQCLQDLHKEYFNVPSPFFEIDTEKKTPEKTEAMVLDALRSYKEADPLRLIEPVVNVIQEKLLKSYGYITENRWNNTECKNGCIGLLFAYIFTAINDETTNFETLNAFLKRVIASKAVLPGTGEIVSESKKTVNKVIGLIDVIKAKIDQNGGEQKEPIERILHKLRNTLHAYLLVMIDMMVNLFINPKILKERFHIVDKATQATIPNFSSSLEILLNYANSCLLYMNDTEERNNKLPKNFPISLLDKNKNHCKNIHPMFRTDPTKQPSTTISMLTSTIEELLYLLCQAIALYKDIYWVNKGNKTVSRSVTAMESNLQRSFYCNGVSVISGCAASATQKLDDLLLALNEKTQNIDDQITKLRERLVNSHQTKHLRWVNHNLPYFATQKIKSTQYLKKCQTFIKEYEKTRSAEGQKESDAELREVLAHLSPGYRSIFSPAPKNLPPPIDPEVKAFKFAA